MTGRSNDGTLPAMLAQQASRRGNRLAIAQLGTDGNVAKRRTFEQLHSNALRAAAVLRKQFNPGDRIILAPVAPIEFLEGFLALMYAGLIAVPAPSPRTKAGRHRIGILARNCEATWGFASATEVASLDSDGSESHFASLDTLWEAFGTEEYCADLLPDDIAFLQYTSGSTFDPRGAIITHRCVLANEAQIATACLHDETTIFANWLPLFHDMGLIGGLLQPLYLGVPGYHLTPLQFHARPLRWLQMIERYSVTTTGGPNFAYDACVDRIPESDRKFDLSSWKVAFNGAEPVSAGTLRRFAAAYEPHGFRPASFLPCYGMAEATLFVTGGPAGTGELPIDDAPVSCGLPPLGIRCLIADAESQVVLDEGSEGEILVAGENVSPGYWKESDNDRSKRYVHIEVDGEMLRFLRSGDLGFLRSGRLHVTGRIKDLIIREGRNFHPSDLENVARNSMPPGRHNNTAAFMAENGKVVILLKCDEQDESDYPRMAKQLHQQVLDQCGIRTDVVAFVLNQHLPMTTSGKIRRGECRRLYEAGLFERIHREMFSTELISQSPDTVEIDINSLRAFSLAFLSKRLSRVIDDAESYLPITDLGLDSLDAVELGMMLSRKFGVEVTGAQVLRAPRLVDLFEDLQSRQLADATERRVSRTIPATSEALLVLAQREAGRPTGNVSVALDPAVDIEEKAVRRALWELTDRHIALRSRFVKGPNGIATEPLGAESITLRVVATTDERLSEAMKKAAEEPFDLFDEPPLRLYFYRRSGEAITLQFVLHHAAVDLWSVSHVLESFCSALSSKTSSFARREPDCFITAISDEERAAGIAYWQRVLPDPIQRVRLPAPAQIQGPGCGKYYPFEFTFEETCQLREYARSRKSTMTAVVLAAYQSALAIFTGERRVIVTVPFHGRDERTANTVGCLVNPLPIVTQVEETDSFETLVFKCRAALLEVLELQRLPVSEAQIQVMHADGRSPLLQFAFAPQNIASAGSGEIAALMLRGFEHSLVLESLPVRSRSIERFEPSADLLLSTAEIRGRMLGCLEFDAARIDADFAASVLELTRDVLRVVAADPSCDASVRVDPNKTGWQPPRVVMGPKPAEEPVPVFDLLNARRQGWNDAYAVEQGDLRWSYAELFAHAECAVSNLRRLGVQTGDRVAMESEITAASVAVIVGLWSLGAVYCPVDSAYPAFRKKAILAQINARLLLQNPEELIGPRAGSNSFPKAGVRADMPAYAIFTSGSSGRPKGVLISHAALANTIGAQKVFGIEAGMRVLQACSPGFDASIFEIVLAAAFGATLVLPANRLTGGEVMREAWKRLRPSAAVLPPSLAAEMGQVDPAPLVLILAGEPCPAFLIDAWAGRCRLYNAYGPTETAIWATIQHLPTRDAVPDIGRPIAGAMIAVADAELRPLPIGAPGELIIGGAGLAIGYISDPELTANRFAYPSHQAGRVYRSGDQVRLRSNGSLEYLGRLDRQVKVHGVRIELAEIENVILQAHGVKQAAVVDLATASGPQLGALVVTSETNGAHGDLRRHLAERLPPAFLPSVIRFEEKLPIDSHGKVDLRAVRDALMKSSLAGEKDAIVHVPLGSQIETIRRVCGEVFHVVPRSMRDNLLLLGVHSLNVARFVGRLSVATQREIPIALVFEHPILSDFAEAVDNAPANAPSENDRETIDTGEYPLTPVQRDLWYLSQTGKHRDYLIPLALEIRGELDEELLSAAFRHVMKSHPSLRAHISEGDDGPIQYIQEEESIISGAFERSKGDWSLDAIHQNMMERIETADVERVFDLRLKLYRINHERHVLGLIGHHILLDGASMGVLLRDLGRSYTALATEGPLPICDSTTQFVRYLREQTRSGAHDAKLRSWKEMLAIVDSGASFLTDRGSSASSQEPHVATFSIGSSEHAGLRGIAAAANVSLFSVATAAFAILIARQRGSQDATVSVVTANRNTDALQQTIGCLVTTLPIAIKTNSNDLVDVFWKTVQRQILNAVTASGPSISQLGALLSDPPTLGRSPLLGAMIVQNDAGFYDFQFDDVRIEAKALPWRFALPPRADVLLEVTDGSEALILRLEADPRIFSEQRTKRMMDGLAHLLGLWAGGKWQTVSETECISPAERKLVTLGFNSTKRPYNLRPLHQLVEEAVDRYADACALTGAGVALSYREFEFRANQLANALITRGLKVGTSVGVCAMPGIGLVIAVHGVMKAGGVYVPLDPASPADRLAAMVKRIGLQFMVAEARTELWSEIVAHVLHPLEAGRDGCRPSVGVNCADAAYVLFTSGSTGRPKGAINRHESIVNRLLWMQEAMPLRAGDRVLQKTSFTFDVSVWELFWPLTVGATLCTMQAGQHLDAAELYSVLRRERIGLVHFVPSALADFLQSRKTFDLPALQRIVSSGEELTPELRDAVWQKLDVEIHNLYGPTEAAIDVTHWRCGRDDGPERVPIGFPIANTAIYILNRQGKPAPIGVPGEIFISGVQVGSGYLGDENETQKCFGLSSFDSTAKWYRSGDAGRWNEDGSIEYLQRLDDQFKIRGVRVEPGEIVAAMKRLEGVVDATILVRGTGSKRQINGFAIMAPEQRLDWPKMRAKLAAALPSVLVPSSIAAIERFPLRQSGKINAAELERLVKETDIAGPEIDPPLSETEQIILGVWQDVLEQPRVSVTANFFEAGGNSAMLMKVQTELTKRLQRQIRVIDLFSYPTIRKLASWLDAEKPVFTATSEASAKAIQMGKRRMANLASVQRNKR